MLDTSVLLSDPAAFRRFTDHEAIIPLVVISELEEKRHHPAPVTDTGSGCGPRGALVAGPGRPAGPG